MENEARARHGVEDVERVYSERKLSSKHALAEKAADERGEASKEERRVGDGDRGRGGEDVKGRFRDREGRVDEERCEEQRDSR